MQNIAITLLITASSLLSQVLALGPRITPELRNQAIQVSNTAIAIANQALAQTPVVSQSAVVINSSTVAAVPDAVSPANTNTDVIAAAPAPLKVPACSVDFPQYGWVPIYTGERLTGYTTTAGLEVDKNADVFFEGHNVSGTPYHARFLNFAVYSKTASSTTYTLTETMSDPAYQTTTTCSGTAPEGLAQ